ncbi:MAG TPA: alpha/beta fold hydrolase [Vicinamibacterales bacterium]|nr:alpha/beta fold hydrolase [Vicinamibacterales bacterium]
MADVVRDIPGPAGTLEAMLDAPAGAPRAAVVFAHPLPTAGGTMHTKAVYQGTKALVRTGCAVLRFNFRGVGRSAGSWDDGRGEQEDYRAALDFMAARYPGVELWAAGFSFGSYVAWAVAMDDPRVCALIAVAPPVSTWEFPDGIYSSAKAKFIVHGEDDELVPLKAVREFYARLREPKEFVQIDRANHLFEAQTPEVGDALEELLSDFSCAMR